MGISLLHFIRVFGVVHFFDADADAALLGHGDVLLFHLLLAARGQLVGPGVDLVADEGADGEEDKEDEQRNQVAESRHLVVVYAVRVEETGSDGGVGGFD